MYKLLLIEDEPLIRKGIRTLIDFDALRISECIEAEDGLEGLELFMNTSPHLVLLDINLPGMNGIELATRFKKMNPDVRIAIITGYDYFDYAVSALRIGIDDYILKPVTRTDIADILFRLIEKHEAAKVNEAVNKTIEQIIESDQIAEGVSSGYRAIIDDALNNGMFNPELSLTSLAATLNLSPSYLSSLFKNLYGIPFQDYVLNRRLEKAKLLLLSGHMKIYEIAEAVGFSDVNYFSTRFRKTYGVSPSQFIQNVRDSNV